MKTNFKLKIWSIVTNIAFILSVIILSLLVNNDDYEKYGLLGSNFFLLSGLIILFLVLTFTSALSALVLNTIYLPMISSLSSSKAILRIFVLILNLVVFLGILYLALNYIDLF